MVDSDAHQLSDGYQLLDCGDGRKLESFAGYVVDRPAPAAIGAARRRPGDWAKAGATFQMARTGGPERGQWLLHHPPPEPWYCGLGAWQLGLRLSESGHVGMFPEQADNWDWLDNTIRSDTLGRPISLLNLFAYTGASTLVAAAAGAHVTHVDAARSTVQWARANARLSELESHPIRWINEDAPRFVEREIKRGRRYDGVILDPPSYGHGAAGRVWKFAEQIEPLLAACRELTGGQPRLMLLTCHTPGVDAEDAAELLATALPKGSRRQITAQRLEILAASGARLDCGVGARWSGAGL